MNTHMATSTNFLKIRLNVISSIAVNMMKIGFAFSVANTTRVNLRKRFEIINSVFKGWMVFANSMFNRAVPRTICFSSISHLSFSTFKFFKAIQAKPFYSRNFSKVIFTGFRAKQVFSRFNFMFLGLKFDFTVGTINLLPKCSKLVCTINTAKKIFEFIYLRLNCFKLNSTIRAIVEDLVSHGFVITNFRTKDIFSLFNSTRRSVKNLITLTTSYFHAVKYGKSSYLSKYTNNPLNRGVRYGT